MTALEATLCILRLPQTGAGTYWRLLDAFKTPQAVIQQSPSALAGILKPVAIASLQAMQSNQDGRVLKAQLAADLEYIASQENLHCLSFEDPAYPELLRQIPKPPPILFVRGNLECLSLPQLAVVGSRNPSAGGLENARDFSAFLARHGVAITSGLALGVDAAAHQGALKVQGKTIAVMGTGIDLIYPGRHRGLAQEILEAGGALVSEFPLGTASQAANFPQRNRIISGLSMGTLVVEAALQSGSLITAALALQHNREVFAIPGSIHNPLARGCHQLIRQGATLVETAQDILDQLGGYLSLKRDEAQQLAMADGRSMNQGAGSFSDELPPPLDAMEQRLLAAIGYDPVTMDLLIERCQMGVGQVASCLIGLEIKGVIQQTEQGFARAS